MLRLALALLAVVVAAALLRGEAGRRLAERAPSTASGGAAAAVGEEPAEGWRELRVRAGPGGHFVVEAAVNGAGVAFLVDTGATGVVLSPDDARRAGLAGGRLRFTQTFATANGTVRAAPVTLRELRIGALRLTGVEASVNEAPMDVSLLGMAFLRRLDGWEVRDGTLVMRW